MAPYTGSAAGYVGASPVIKAFFGASLVWEPGGGGGLPEIGDAFEGGYFVGPVSYNLDGVATHALIVGDRTTAARGAGYPTSTGLRWQINNTVFYPGFSISDGSANLDLMVSYGLSNFPAGEWCADLVSGGFSDWFLPATYELAAAYVNLKPGTASNITTTGSNTLMVPQRGNYSASDPLQTVVVAFQSGGLQAFSLGLHWSSRSTTTSGANSINLTDGTLESSRSKLNTDALRAFRRVAL